MEWRRLRAPFLLRCGFCRPGMHGQRDFDACAAFGTRPDRKLVSARIQQFKTAAHIVQSDAGFEIHRDADAVALHRVPATLRKYKNVLRRAEVRSIVNRLNSLQRDKALPIPKGMDPARVRAPRPR